MALHVVEAYPETCQVQTYQRSKTVWVASGEFRGVDRRRRRNPGRFWSSH
jgi:hypothetical protein